MKLLHPLITLCTIITLTEASGWWMDQPYQDESEFNSQVEYEENTTLTCGDQSGEFRHWIRPDMVTMGTNASEYFRVLYGTAGWWVNDENNDMHIIFVQERHFGFYYCVLYDTPNYIYVKKALNYKAPYFGDLWEKYELNVIIGCSAAGGFLLACIIIYLVHHFFLDSHIPDDVDSNNVDHHGRANDYEMGNDSYKTKGDIAIGITNAGYDNPTEIKSADGELQTQL